jgi:hypothetical protein
MFASGLRIAPYQKEGHIGDFRALVMAVLMAPPTPVSGLPGRAIS